ncbi:ribosomal RNA processing protein 36 homolog [Hemiscyllium ocellatum]|uniref:ribosomal RNA processing protein 36 homolog n=1 Tax=Hemiscyllium ocellatum TaxID=170820 RepID=UPI0029660CE9|nr:ribosomal RNA processing protein 36 homolog [Hemiscyllium ocellatum]
MSSKRPVPYLRKVLPVNRKLRRDPRFDDLSGEFKAEIYDKTYSFLTELRHEEKTAIRKKLKKVKDPEQQEELRALLQRMTQQDEAQTRRQKQSEWLQEFRQEQRERVQQGKRPYFLKKSEQRKLELAEKYLALKKTGKLERFLGRKRKRNAEKDRGRLPQNKSR